MDKQDYYKYKLWAWTYYPYPILKKEWTKTIYRKNKPTDKQKESLSGHFADRLASKHNKSILLYLSLVNKERCKTNEKNLRVSA